MAGLDAVLRHPGVWRGRDTATRPATAYLDTGFEALRDLPGGGWPRGALSEILYAGEGLGELRLLAPALAALSQAGEQVAWVAPPHIPYAPGLAYAGIDPARMLWVRAGSPEQAFWAAEQLARCAACGALLYWPEKISDRRIRRLQLAAEAGGGAVVMFRSVQAARHASVAALRVAITAGGAHTRVRVLKCRGRMVRHERTLTTWR